MRSLGSTTRVFRRTMLALGCAFALGACTTWREAPPPAPAALHEFTAPVHVIRHGTFSLVLRNAYVKGDTLYGYSAKTLMAVALHDVKAIRQEKIQRSAPSASWRLPRCSRSAWRSPRSSTSKATPELCPAGDTESG